MVKKKLKVVMLGEGRVGKTSLLQRYLSNGFDEAQPSTVKAQMYANSRMEVNGHVADVAIWDTAGQEQYHALGPLYYRDSHGAVLVYDITDKESFNRVRVWLRELHQIVGESIAVCVVGNKIDLERERKVNKADAESWCKENGAIHILASAKLGLRVPDVFQAVVAKALDRELAKLGPGNGGDGTALGLNGNSSGAGGRQRGVKVSMEETRPQAQARDEKKCCK